MNIIFEPDHGYYHHKGKLSTLDLEKVARHHSRLLAIENMKLKHRVKELEKHVEKAERVEETEQLIEKALNKRKK